MYWLSLLPFRWSNRLIVSRPILTSARRCPASHKKHPMTFMAQFIQVTSGWPWCPITSLLLSGCHNTSMKNTSSSELTLSPLFTRHLLSKPATLPHPTTQRTWPTNDQVRMVIPLTCLLPETITTLAILRPIHRPKAPSSLLVTAPLIQELTSLLHTLKMGDVGTALPHLPSL